MKNIKSLLSNGNEFFQLAAQGKRITHWALILPVFMGIFILSVYITGFTAELFFGTSEKINYFKETYITFLMFGLIIVFIALWVRLFEKRTFSSLGFTRNEAIRKYLKGFALGLVLMAIIVGLISSFGGVEIVQNPGNAYLPKVTIFISLLVFIIQGASEEILFRGWFMQILGKRFKPVVGIIVSTFLFTLFHGANSGFNVVVAINLILFSIVFVQLILKGNSLWAASGFHSSWNWVICNFFGFTLSGIEPEVFGASVFSLKGVGKTILSGADFGPEGSIVATAVFIIYFGFLYWIKKRKKPIV